jgi:formylmethanofuran dehydrogenase subunit C
MPLVLAPLAGPAAPLSIDLDGIVPDRLAGLDAAAIARLTVRADARERALGDLFAIAGDPRDGRIECRGDFSRVHGVAAGMQSGRIDVHGPVGRHAGRGMAGGKLTVAGDAGDWLAADMSGGEVVVAGAAGDNAAAALPGSRCGMRGGLVVVSGSVGHLAGARMRRGILAIGGDCGEAAAFEMRAGTVLVAGRLGRHPAAGMSRGSVVALGEPPVPPPTFVAGAAWQPSFLPLLLHRLAASGFRPAARAGGVPWRQWHGDSLAGGRGEILARA